MFRSLLCIIGAAVLLGACGHLRHTPEAGNYRGVGDFKVASDYRPSPSLTSQPSSFKATQMKARSVRAFTASNVANANAIRHPDTAETRQGKAEFFQAHWPVANVRIHRGFRTAKGPDHQGLDLGGRMGAPILAAERGTVIYAGHDFRGYGNMILIEHKGEWATLYGHLSKLEVTAGAKVAALQKIGQMGRSGHASGVHLHFELMHHKQPVDPLLFLPKTQDRGTLADNRTDEKVRP